MLYQVDWVYQDFFRALAGVLYQYREELYLDQASFLAPALDLYPYQAEPYLEPVWEDFLYRAS